MTLIQNAAVGIIMGVVYFFIRLYRGMELEEAALYGVAFGMIVVVIRVAAYAIWPQRKVRKNRIELFEV